MKTVTMQNGTRLLYDKKNNEITIFPYDSTRMITISDGDVEEQLVNNIYTALSEIEESAYYKAIFNTVCQATRRVLDIDYLHVESAEDIFESTDIDIFSSELIRGIVDNLETFRVIDLIWKSDRLEGVKMTNFGEIISEILSNRKATARFLNWQWYDDPSRF